MLLTRALPATAAATFAAFLVPAFAANDPPVTTAKLPLTRVTLFTAGVGYFHREGTVDGTARVDLRVPEEDVNDLIKTLVATDADGGTARAVTFDHKAPAEVTLKAFRIDLTENPSVADLLTQARGERVEITDKAGTVTTGSIVSLERPATETSQIVDENANARTKTTSKPAADPGAVNVMTDDGLESVALKTVKKVKFTKPELQAEFRKALEALAAAHGAATKAVGVTFAGKGPRKVSVGYVAEAPLWKPSYRLTLDEKAARVQGWAAVENTTDEDWENVKVSLASGRPMTFQMDLYDPLFVPRPTVEPELYASLRPPLYQGNVPVPVGGLGGGVGNRIGQLGGAGIQGGVAGGFGGQANPLNQIGVQNNLGVGGGVYGFAGVPSMSGGASLARPSLRQLLGSRLSYEELQSRGATTKEPAKPSPSTGPTASADFGQSFRYEVAEPVSLPRFKSALLPVVSEPASVTRVSIYNPAALTNHPLLGVRLTNSSKLFLAQGPVAVYDAGTYAGDARLPDVKPGETRLLSYAIDLNTDATTLPRDETDTPKSLKIAAGKVRETVLHRRATTYRFTNRTADARTVLVTHPVSEGWALTAPEKPTDRTADLYRFEVALPGNASAVLEVVEERTTTTDGDLNRLSADATDRLVKLPVASPAVRAALEKAKADRAAVVALEKTLVSEEAALKAVLDGQVRLRENIAKLPKESQAFQRYLKKFDDQETEIEQRQAKVKDLTAELEMQRLAVAAAMEKVSAE